MVVGTTQEGNRTHIQTFSSYVEATQRLRLALGVMFSDYFNLGQFNLLVEGKSDRELIQWFLLQVPPDIREWAALRSAHLLDFGGVKHLGGFLRATYPMIQPERAALAVFDGDDAGVKERQALQSYFGNKKFDFQPNVHFLSVRRGFAIEGLFPDSWIVDLHTAHPGWFEQFAVDVSGQLEPYRLKDGHKTDAQNALVSRAERDPSLAWADHWLQFGDAANNALAKLDEKLPHA